MILVVPFKYYILPKRTHGSLSGFREFRCVIGGTASEASRAQKARTPINHCSVSSPCLVIFFPILTATLLAHVFIVLFAIP